MSKEAIVLLSGGQDSATCLAEAIQSFDSVHCVAFNYGQRHRIELDQAKVLAQLAGASFQEVALPFINDLTANALTRHDEEITTPEGGLPTTFVPGRNLFFISVAAVIAHQRGASVIYTGVCQTDYSGYPDCRDDFVKSLKQSLSLGMDYDFDILTPLMTLTKAETVLRMKALGHLDWYESTHTCYEGHRPACGKCPACDLRLKGFAEAGISDPLAYA
ncbi:7-cyano-7-deazaguanine synthase QueC [bacterium]|jgi:7-cyano-7-deazaguanine synthase|nr:7-cyano-7-deazaguanine synthase QueC [bacterium]